MDDAASHIQEAILHGRTDIVKMLIAEVQATLKSKYTNNDNLENEFDAFLNSKYTNTSTFLHQAVLQRHRDLIRALLQEGADPSVICMISNDDNTLEENAFEAAIRLSDSLGSNSLSGFSHVFGEMLFQATASSR